jgi:hypothetical protein
MKTFLLLVTLYAALVIDTVTGLHLNFYGYGREPLVFALGAVVLASALYRWAGAWLGMITLVLCCVWLLFYPSKNGFDVVLAPLLFIRAGMWGVRLWQTYKTKK